MDLGLNGCTAIVCASSRGLGKAAAMSLARAGCTVVVNGRDGKQLDATAAEIRAATGATVIPVAADVGDKAGQDALLAAAPQVDILINNNGGPPPKGFRELNREAMLSGVVQNMVTPIELIQRVIDGMIARKFGRIVNITSASVVTPLPGLDLSSGARAGLTSFLAGVAREVAPHGVTINNVMPGMFDTDRLKGTTKKMAEAQGKTPDEVAAARKSSVPVGRFGDPAEFGELCAFWPRGRRATSPARTSSSTAACSVPPSERKPEHGPVARRSVSIAACPWFKGPLIPRRRPALSPLYGITLKLISGIAFTAMSALIKALSVRYPVGQLVFFRAFFALVPLLVWLAWIGQLRDIGTRNPLGHLKRGVIGSTGMFLGFAALGLMALPDVVAIGYAAPLIVVVLAAVILGETVRVYRWSAVAIGFIGVIFMLAPHLAPERLAALTQGGPALGAILALGGRSARPSPPLRSAASPRPRRPAPSSSSSWS